jgi:hypothetical protein
MVFSGPNIYQRASIEADQEEDFFEDIIILGIFFR